jgi:hypothetical protein
MVHDVVRLLRRKTFRAVPFHQQLIDSELLFNVNANRVTDLFNLIFDERITLHSVIHTFITKARAAGVSNVLVQQLVGHEKSGAGQTDRYTHAFHLKDVLPVVGGISFEVISGYRYLKILQHYTCLRAEDLVNELG